jgi:hypothetical protein
MAEQMDPVEPERLADRDDLLDERLHDPERCVIWVIGPTAPELVVEHHRAACLGQLGR